MISVIVPVYNVEKFLPDCIESILAQTFTDFELILVNDGSEDKCPSICESYRHIDRRIRVINKKNGGLSDARNLGIDHAHGEYLTFVDSDDMIAPCYLEVLYNLILENDSDISCVNDCTIKESTHLTDVMIKNMEKQELTIGNIEMLNSFYYIRQLVNGGTAWGKLYHRKLFDEIRYPVGRIHEDDFTTYKLYLISSSISMCNLPLYLYRDREGSIMKKRNEKSEMDLVDSAIEKLNVTFGNENLRKFKRYSADAYFAHFKLILGDRNAQRSYAKKYKENFLLCCHYASLRYKILGLLIFLFPFFSKFI